MPVDVVDYATLPVLTAATIGQMALILQILSIATNKAIEPLEAICREDTRKT